ncbi:MAG: hypothetical protein KIT18_15615 [Burkholderiales bacterium]|nr:hypothetical protein [Burkholderiales bacterium]
MAIRILKGITRTVLCGVLLIMIAYGVLLLVNLNDRPLPEQARAFADAAKLDVPPEQNGYFALLGLSAPEHADSHDTGRRGFEHYVVEIRAGRVEDGATVDTLPSEDQKLVCEQRRANCFEKIETNRREVDALLARHGTRLARIHKLARYPYFHAPQFPYHPYSPVMAGDVLGSWKLGATASAHAWLSGRRETALDLSAARIAVARRMLRDSGGLINTALAAAWLRSEFLLLAEILQRDPDGVRAHIQTFERLLAPLAADELHATRWVHGEYASQIDGSRAFPKYEAQRRMLLGDMWIPDRMIETEFFSKNLPVWFKFAVTFAAPLFQPDATAGALLPVYAQHWMEDVRAPARAVAARRGTAPMLATTGWSLYNPLGAAYVRHQFSARILDYITRLHDLDRFIRLVAVQAMLIKARVPVGDVEAFVAAHPAAIDPATGAPMRWDRVASRLWIEALSPHWERLYGGAIGGVPDQIGVHY